MDEQNLKFIFGLKLNQLRSKKNLSLKELSAASGVSASYLNEIEKGKKYPKADKIVALAEALDISYDDLVSLKLEAELNPLSEILKNGTLQDIPFELFGLEPSDIMELMSNSPMKFSALLDTFSKIARNYDMRVEHLLFAAMRSYQEMNNNYFEDIENKVDIFVKKYARFDFRNKNAAAMAELLTQQYGIEVKVQHFSKEEAIDGIRSINVPGKHPKLLLNEKLIEAQRKFLIAKEIGFQELGLKERAHVSVWNKVDTFDKLLNNFKTSYFAGALLIPRNELVNELKEFFKKPQWDGEAFLAIMNRFDATPEMYFHRLSQLLPHYFEIDQLYFLRFNHHMPTDFFTLTKELHFSRLHQPHGVGLSEHYCRRWITLILLKDLAAQKNTGTLKYPIVGVQKSRFHQTENEYFCVSMARPLVLNPEVGSCVTLGFVMTEKFKRRVRFWNDDRIKLLTVNKTCERCGIADCNERVAQPVIFERLKAQQKMEDSLHRIIQENQ
ncbi:MAG: helix-turn-helix domain-containing protein [Candidatus Cyclonatronum sp.]|uniref:helix-turn-helix domain-containing protein n=1 Tax=Cyclonatronum sp. TaxID=3024185 RepID=UPI0025C37C96|nr:helix-turn-helix domain-containing protein [Cyclonatronum sp.]MCC5932788.1 helix-turn-helix domain-containing protein [Balneolales bacterium]MCH8485993.1 helix-turn-helix domain-containing protein [Cyclonatronum sp.]